MGRKERNPIKRIEQATRASKRKYTSSLQDLARESIPGEWITEIIEYPATVPVGAEFELLQDVLASSDNVFYKPRRRREYQSEGVGKLRRFCRVLPNVGIIPSHARPRFYFSR